MATVNGSSSSHGKNDKRKLSLHEILRMLEDYDERDIPQNSVLSIVTMPPNNETEGNITDEDSGDEDEVILNNLPGSQLRAEAEIEIQSIDIDNSVAQKNTHEKKKKKYVWKKGNLKKINISWPTKKSVPNNSSPIELFSNFFDDELIFEITSFTNLYSARKNKILNASSSEIRCFIGVLILSGYVSVPRRRLYWEMARDTHNELVSNALSRDRFELIMANFHCCDNEKIDTHDRFAKVRFLFDYLNKRFQEFAPHSENHCVDEAMVPYFGKHGCKQFIKGKPIRYGFKLWVGATSYGYVVWMEPYQGAKSVINESYKDYGLGPSVDVLLTLDHFPYHIFFDNFTTVPLIEELSQRNIRGTGTIRENRMSKCPLVPNAEMKKKCRGSYDTKVTNDRSIVIVKWNDNNIVNVASNSVSVFPMCPVSRFSQKDKKKISIDQPGPVRQYNKYMGGVDRSDQNVSLYRIGIRGKKWYFCLISQCIDLAVQNSWHLHRQQGGKLDQLTFRRRIAMALLETNQSKGQKRSHTSALENADSRYDENNHWIATQGKQTRCRICHRKVSTICEKCNVALHVNCFKMYHIHD